MLIRKIILRYLKIILHIHYKVSFVYIAGSKSNIKITLQKKRLQIGLKLFVINKHKYDVRFGMEPK